MEWSQKVYNWLRSGQWLSPVCPLCHGAATTTRDGGFCPGCRNDLPELGAACVHCAAPLPVAGICGPCLRRPPPYRALAAFRYESPLSDLLIDLKFHGRLALARPLGELLADGVAGQPRPEAIIPVPLHPKRLRERGYNQALELARPVAARLAIPLLPDLGVRLRATATQSKLDPAERRRNMRGAFGVSGTVPASVAVVDDVITTGSTARAFAEALRRGGAQEIQIWAVARAASQ